MGGHITPPPGSLALITTPDPEIMTAEERRLEVAGILAYGLVRHVRTARTGLLPTPKTVSKRSKTGLDVPVETRLSVAARPAG